MRNKKGEMLGFNCKGNQRDMAYGSMIGGLRMLTQCR